MKKCKRCGVELTVDNTKWPGLPREKMDNMCIFCYAATHPKYAIDDSWYVTRSHNKKERVDKKHTEKIVKMDLEDSNE